MTSRIRTTHLRRRLTVFGLAAASVIGISAAPASAADSRATAPAPTMEAKLHGECSFDSGVAVCRVTAWGLKQVCTLSGCTKG